MYKLITAHWPLTAQCFVLFTRHSCTGRYCWERILAMGILSVCLSVTTRWYTKPRWDRHSGSSPYDSLESLVSNEVIWCQWLRRFPRTRASKRGTPLRNRNFTTIGSSSVRTVADRHRLAAYHNKHCRRAFQWYQHRRPWTTLNPQIGGFSEFSAILGCNAHFRTELRRNHSR